MTNYCTNPESVNFVSSKSSRIEVEDCGTFVDARINDQGHVRISPLALVNQEHWVMATR